MLQLIRIFFVIAVIAPTLLIGGCSFIANKATNALANSITNGILNQEDPRIVKDGAPAYLLLIGGLIEDNPKNTGLLVAGARLYGSYGSVFVDEPDRARKMTAKAWSYGRRALCQRYKQACDLHKLPFQEYTAFLKHIDKRDVAVLYAYAVSWAGWIQLHTDDLNAVASIPKVRAAMERVVELDDRHDGGGAHMYLGVLATLLPPSLGGKPKKAKMHFEYAINISGNRNLMARVLFAERYARTVFNKKLHDRLLKEVLASKVKEPGLTLMNILAQEKARKLLKSSKNYF